MSLVELLRVVGFWAKAAARVRGLEEFAGGAAEVARAGGFCAWDI